MSESRDKYWQQTIDRFKRWMMLERHNSANSIESYVRDVEELSVFLVSFVDCDPEATVERPYADVLPENVDTAMIEGYLLWLFDTKHKASSQNRMLSGVRAFYKFMLRKQMIDTDPTALIDSAKVARHVPDVLTVEQIDAMEESIDLSSPLGHRNRAIIETLYSCGLRVSELCTLRINDLFFDDGVIRVVGKGDKQRLVPVSGEAVKQINLWLECRGAFEVNAQSRAFLFLNRRGGQLSRIQVFNIVRDAVAAAGIHKSVSPHTLRHSFATHLLQGGADIGQVQKLLGHESVATTEIYTHLDKGDLTDAVEHGHPMGAMFKDDN